MIPKSGAADAHSADCDIARTIAHLHAESWRVAYRGFYSDHFLDHEIHAERLAFWNQRVPELRRLDAQLFLATVNGEPAGFTCVEYGPHCTHGAYVDNLHVLPRFQGVGIGKLLLNHAAQWAKARSLCTFYLFVFEFNHAARGFYAANGWFEDGGEVFTTVTGQTAPTLRLVRMV